MNEKLRTAILSIVHARFRQERLKERKKIFNSASFDDVKDFFELISNNIAKQFKI